MAIPNVWRNTEDSLAIIDAGDCKAKDTTSTLLISSRSEGSNPKVADLFFQMATSDIVKNHIRCQAGAGDPETVVGPHRFIADFDILPCLSPPVPTLNGPKWDQLVSCGPQLGFPQSMWATNIPASSSAFRPRCHIHRPGVPGCTPDLDINVDQIQCCSLLPPEHRLKCLPTFAIL